MYLIAKFLIGKIAKDVSGGTFLTYFVTSFMLFYQEHKKCGEWPHSFATIVANVNILLDTAEVEHSLKMQISKTAMVYVTKLS